MKLCYTRSESILQPYLPRATPNLPVMLKALIIEDETMLSDLLSEFFTHSVTCKLLGTYSDGQEGWEQIQSQKPDFVLLDIRLPSLNGLEILRRTKEALPKIKVLLFSGSFLNNHIKQALELEADGMIEKAAGLNEMQKAIETIASGKLYFSPSIMTAMRQIMIEPEQTGSIESLSPREREVLQLVSEGYSTKEIASKLGIEVKTVETHRTSLAKKLNVKGIAGLTRYSIKEGLVD